MHRSSGITALEDKFSIAVVVYSQTVALQTGKLTL